MPFALRAFMMKRYSSHRGVPDSALAAVDKDIAGRVQKLSGRATRTSSGSTAKRLADARALAKHVEEYKAKVDAHKTDA